MGWKKWGNGNRVHDMGEVMLPWSYIFIYVYFSNHDIIWHTTKIKYLKPTRKELEDKMKYKWQQITQNILHTYNSLGDVEQMKLILETGFWQKFKITVHEYCALVDKFVFTGI